MSNDLLLAEIASIKMLNAQTENSKEVSNTLQGQAIAEGVFLTAVNKELNVLSTAVQNASSKTVSAAEHAYTNYSTIAQNKEQLFGNDQSTLQGLAQADSQNTQQSAQFAQTVNAPNTYMGSLLQQNI